MIKTTESVADRDLIACWLIVNPFKVNQPKMLSEFFNVYFLVWLTSFYRISREKIQTVLPTLQCLQAVRLMTRTLCLHSIYVFGITVKIDQFLIIEGNYMAFHHHHHHHHVIHV